MSIYLCHSCYAPPLPFRLYKEPKPSCFRAKKHINLPEHLNFVVVMAGAVIFPLQLSALAHNSSKKNSVLSKRGLLQSSFALKPTEGVPVRKCDRSSILCSADRRAKRTSAAAVPKPIPLVAPELVDIPEPKRSDFPSPPDFYFGVASSAFQVEGAWNADGKGENIWDRFTRTIDNIDDRSNADIACDAYNRFHEDIEKMKEMGVEAYRFSISWTRILPDGTLQGGVNEKGVAYYNKLINMLIDNGIAPIVTLFHWDVPQALETKYGGFLSKNIVNDAKDFANVCFQQFGDRVKHWVTVNEPWTFATNGYVIGWHAPGRGMRGGGDPTTEPYTVAHNLILTHGAIARLYKEKFQPYQRGKVGMTNVCIYFLPYSDSKKSQEAQERAMEFVLGWFVNPLITGEYPKSMKENVGDRLPVFKDNEKKMIIDSFDFLGINYYTSKFAKDPSEGHSNATDGGGFLQGYFKDMEVDQRTTDVNGKLIGELQGSWINVVPVGIRDLLKYMKEKYEDPEIMITENGTCQIDFPEKDAALTREQALDDHERIKYMKLHIEQIQFAKMYDKIKVIGYFVWSLTDNFEWQRGYTERFGLVYIDYANGLERVLKRSAGWYAKFLKS